jgi:glutamine cyclotransferase
VPRTGMTCFIHPIGLTASALGAAAMSAMAALALECPSPQRLDFVVEKKITRSLTGYTQGLEFRDGRLYESTGPIKGETRLNIIDLDGKVTTLADLGTNVFGEGLTILNGEVFQLTWKDYAVFVYDLDGKRLRQMTNPRFGWGLANDGKELIFTDGEGSLHYADPKTFTITREVPLRAAAGAPPTWLNELEYVDGKLYGNVFMTDWIVRVDPASGCLEAGVDLSPLKAAMTENEKDAIAASIENVLNGIARDPDTGLFYITGKSWPMIYVGRLREAS